MIIPRRTQARPLYAVRDPRPTPLRPWRFNWIKEAAKLLASVALVIAAVLLWVVRPGVTL